MEERTLQAIKATIGCPQATPWLTMVPMPDGKNSVYETLVDLSKVSLRHVESHQLGRTLSAMSLWEAVVDANREKASKTWPRMAPWFERFGWGEMRSAFAQRVDWIDAIWNQTPDELCEGISFDWEFCPLVLHHMDWEATFDETKLFRDPKIMADLMSADLKKHLPPQT